MILVDTSVWIDHLRTGVAELAAALDAGVVLGHPFVAGELALGGLRSRTIILTALDALPRAVVASAAEVRHFIEAHGLAGKGIGYVDTHLLASSALGGDVRLWTRHRRLAGVAASLGVSHRTDS